MVRSVGSNRAEREGIALLSKYHRRTSPVDPVDLARREGIEGGSLCSATRRRFSFASRRSGGLLASIPATHNRDCALVPPTN
jgi:hypothetical protein